MVKNQTSNSRAECRHAVVHVHRCVVTERMKRENNISLFRMIPKLQLVLHMNHEFSIIKAPDMNFKFSRILLRAAGETWCTRYDGIYKRCATCIHRA